MKLSFKNCLAWVKQKNTPFLAIASPFLMIFVLLSGCSSNKVTVGDGAGINKMENQIDFRDVYACHKAYCQNSITIEDSSVIMVSALEHTGSATMKGAINSLKQKAGELGANFVLVEITGSHKVTKTVKGNMNQTTGVMEPDTSISYIGLCVKATAYYMPYRVLDSFIESCSNSSDFLDPRTEKEKERFGEKSENNESKPWWAPKGQSIHDDK